MTGVKKASKPSGFLSLILKFETAAFVLQREVLYAEGIHLGFGVFDAIVLGFFGLGPLRNGDPLGFHGHAE